MISVVSQAWVRSTTRQVLFAAVSIKTISAASPGPGKLVMGDHGVLLSEIEIACSYQMICEVAVEPPLYCGLVPVRRSLRSVMGHYHKSASC